MEARYQLRHSPVSCDSEEPTGCSDGDASRPLGKYRRVAAMGCVKECGQSLRVFLLCSGRLDEVFSGAVVIVPSLYRCPVAQR